MCENSTTFPTATENTQQFRQPATSMAYKFAFKTSVTILVDQITTGVIIVIIHCGPG